MKFTFSNLKSRLKPKLNRQQENQQERNFSTRFAKRNFSTRFAIGFWNFFEQTFKVGYFFQYQLTHTFNFINSSIILYITVILKIHTNVEQIQKQARQPLNETENLYARIELLLTRPAKYDKKVKGKRYIEFDIAAKVRFFNLTSYKSTNQWGRKTRLHGIIIEDPTAWNNHPSHSLFLNLFAFPFRFVFLCLRSPL